MNPIKQFDTKVAESIRQIGLDKDYQALSRTWKRETNSYDYKYIASFLGPPIIQYPQYMMAIQELIWKVKPDLIIETGIAHGDSLIMSASMLVLLDMSSAIESGSVLIPRNSMRKVLGLDIDIRQHNREEIEANPMCSCIQMIQGSSIAPKVIEQVKAVAKNYQRVMVCLDSKHSHDHVLAQLDAYAPLASVGSYCVVMGTSNEDMRADMFPDHPRAPSDNPKTAVWEYLKTHSEFEVDKVMNKKSLISVATDQYLKRIK